MTPVSDLLGSLAPYWLWLIAAAVLAIAEIVAPGVFLIWVAAAALLTGLVTLLLPLPAAAQFLLFAITAVVSVFAGRRFLARHPIVSDDPMLNDRSARLVGMIVTAIGSVDALQGRVKVGDSIWSARGADANDGERLRVTSVESGILIVERA